MKINRLTRVIAVILVLSMLPLWMLGCGKVTDTVSERLVEMMVGDGKLKDKYSHSMEYVQTLDAEVTYLRSYFDTKTGFWHRDDMIPGSSYQGVFNENLYKMMVAYCTKESAHYHDRKILKMVKSGLEYLFNEPDADSVLSGHEKENLYKLFTTTESLDWAEYLVRTLLILKEEGKLSKSKLKEYGLKVEELVGNPYGTGVTLARSSYIVIAHAALVNDEAKLLNAIEKLTALASNVTNGSGLYADGSFMADGKVAANGSYGIVAFSEMVEIAYAIQGEACDFNSELKIPEYMYNWAMKSIIPSIYNGRAFVSGTSSYTDEAEYLGGRAVSSMLALASYFEEAGDDAKATELRSIVKGYAESSSTEFHRYLTTYGATQFEDLMKDDDISAKKIEGAYNYAAVDRLNILGPVYSASVSMSSYRTAKYETRYNRFDLLEEVGLIYSAINGNGWYTGDGMLMIYTSDYAPSSNYWKYVNGQRIPGTTIASIEREEISHDGSTGNRYEAGSVTLGNFAVSAFYSTANNTTYLSSIQVKKSWFFFDNEIVALGAGLSSEDDKFGNTDYSVETVIENIFTKFNSITTRPEQDGDIKLSDGREDNAASDAIYALGYGGIYVPAEKNDQLKYSLNVTDGGNFIEVWLDHTEYTTDEDGELVYDNTFSGKTYEYVIVPSTAMNIKQFYEYVNKTKDGSSVGYTVLANTEQVQAVKDSSSGVVGYTFWEAAEVNGVSSDFACSVIVKETDTQITVSVADFTHTSVNGTGHINLGITGAVASASEGLKLEGGVLEVNRSIAASGNTLTIVINK